MATAEKIVSGSQQYRAILAALFLATVTPLAAQDQGGGNGADAAGEAEVPTDEPVQRKFVRSSSDSGALAQQYPHLAVWLEPEDAPRVLGLVEREATGTPSGAVVILAGEGQSANDGLLEGLRSRLSKAGWATMTLGLEQPSPSLRLARERLASAPSSADDGGEDAGAVIDVNDQVAKDLLESHREVMNGRLAAAVAWFAEREYQRVVLVGVGRGADDARAFLSEAPSVVRQVVWVAADFGGQSPEDISQLPGGGQALPVLDLYSSRGASAPDRAAAFRRAGLASYEAQAVPVSPRPAGRHAGVIANRLLGWLGSD
ncbi:DUF3530 family protein [Marinobacter lacisalsi]|uniref:DUF3530 family protein n=1 Tax=Marinobacter lacisalsi TaxID=475979 RepID=A0ABV8QJK6_9GAMM